MVSVMLVLICFMWCQMCLRQARIKPADPEWVNMWTTALQAGTILLIFLVIVTGVHFG